MRSVSPHLPLRRITSTYRIITHPLFCRHPEQKRSIADAISSLSVSRPRLSPARDQPVRPARPVPKNAFLDVDITSTSFSAIAATAAAAASRSRVVKMRRRAQAARPSGLC
jgi:hypothetical protein